MPLLPKLYSIFWNIDQESILNFFNINEPTLYVTGHRISTPLSLQTLRLVFYGLFNRCTDKLGIKDIENLMIVITFVRFFLMAYTYNTEVAFYISLISFFASTKACEFILRAHVMYRLSTFFIILM